MQVFLREGYRAEAIDPGDKAGNSRDFGGFPGVWTGRFSRGMTENDREGFNRMERRGAVEDEVVRGDRVWVCEVGVVHYFGLRDSASFKWLDWVGLGAMGGFKHIERKEDTAEWQRRTIEWGGAACRVHNSLR